MYYEGLYAGNTLRGQYVNIWVHVYYYYCLFQESQTTDNKTIKVM